MSLYVPSLYFVFCLCLRDINQVVYSSGKDILDQNTGFAAANHQLSRRCHRPPPDKKEGKTTLLPLMRLFFFPICAQQLPRAGVWIIHSLYIWMSDNSNMSKQWTDVLIEVFIGVTLCFWDGVCQTTRNHKLSQIPTKPLNAKQRQWAGDLVCSWSIIKH